MTNAYWAFTLTDGALRMLVLLHFRELGYTPIELAFLFLFYEFFGVVTNLVGGWLASRVGLRVTLLGGLALQIVALMMLTLVSASWSRAASVAYVMGAQSLSGDSKGPHEDKRQDLSAARFFLFGARDIWFVVGVPVFLSVDLGWGFTEVGSFLAVWVIGYGVIQSAAPAFISRWSGGRAPQGRAAQVLAFMLAGATALVAVGTHWAAPEAVILGGLSVFGVIFAINSPSIRTSSSPTRTGTRSR